MLLNKISTRIQSVLGITKSELTFVSIIFLGLIIGVLYNNFCIPNSNIIDYNLHEQISKSLDSIAEVNKTTYIACDSRQNSIKKLKDADTIIEKEKLFPDSKKKDIPSGLININNASKVQLMKLPGIGEKTAISIIEFRRSNPFRNISDIMLVKGIGQKKFDKMKPFITIN